MNISFDEKFCKNLEKSLKTEWLEINKLGSYSSSTIYGLNNKKEHGLFVVNSFDPKFKINLLSKFEETVFVKDYSFELSANQYENSISVVNYERFHSLLQHLHSNSLAGPTQF